MFQKLMVMLLPICIATLQLFTEKGEVQLITKKEGYIVGVLRIVLNVSFMISILAFVFHPETLSSGQFQLPELIVFLGALVALISAVVMVVECSASMAAQDVQGQTRLDAAKQRVKERIRSLPDQTVVSLIAFDARSRVLLSRSRNHRECLRLLEELTPTPIEGKPESALTVAQRLADLETHSRIWMASDSQPPASTTVDWIPVALTEPLNVGLTGFQIRHSPLARDRYEAFLKVSASAGNKSKTTTTLEVSISGRIAQLRELDLDPGESSALILPLIEGAAPDDPALAAAAKAAR
jgi:hypothetical protein